MMVFMAEARVGARALKAWAADLVFGDAEYPVSLAFLDGRLYYSERLQGKIMALTDAGPVVVVEFEDLNAEGEQGLLGIKFHPRFSEKPYIYAYYTRSADREIYNQLVRVRLDEDGLEPIGGVEVLLDRIPAGRYHNGGIVEFSPDEKVFLTTGETHRRTPAQDPRSPSGKVLRFNPDGSIPEDNPWPGNPVYTIGHRNVFGLTFHPETGDAWITENGPDRNDEVNLLIPGGNYGWPNVTGPSRDYIDPVKTYEEVIAPTDCTFIHGGPYPDEYQNSLVFGDWLRGRIHLLKLERDESTDTGWTVADEQILIRFKHSVVDVERRPDGMLFVSTEGGIFELSCK